MDGVTELNPHHPVTEAYRGQYEKLLVLVLWKYHRDEGVLITSHDISMMAEANRGGLPVLAVIDKSDGLRLRTVTQQEGEKLVKQSKT